jgi:hypothetical protein
VAVTLRPTPAEPLGDGPVAFFTTAPPERAGGLAEQLGADVVAVVPALSDRPALREALERDDVARQRRVLVE